MKMLFKVLLLLLSMTPLFAEILFIPEASEQGWSLEIINNSDQVYDLLVFSTNPDYLPDPGQLTIEPGDSALISVKMKPGNEKVFSEEPVLLRLISDHLENPGVFTLGNSDFDEGTIPENGEVPGAIILEYYYTPSCPSCLEFIQTEIPRLEDVLTRTLHIKKIDVTTSEGLIALNARLQELKSHEKKLPIVIINRILLAGDQQIEDELEETLLRSSHNEPFIDSPASAGDAGRTVPFGFLPVLSAGLIDGINPCAFSTLLFLLSWLTLAGRNRKEIMITGLFFTLAVFITYYLVGLGAFSILRSSRRVPLVSAFLKYGMALILFVLGVLHLFDYLKILQGRAGEMTLQLSKKRKKKIHLLIRNTMGRTGLFAGAMILGILVTLYELGCTGQIYLPTLMYMVRIEKGVSSYLLLALYNLGFILPLMILFTAVWKGMGSEKLTLWFKGNLKRMKLISGGFFFLMALLLLFI